MECFFLVPKIVAATKYINISRDEIERALHDNAGEFEYEWEEIIDDDFHQEHCVILRLNIACRGPLMETWSISLKLHSVRIDGIDWHLTYLDPKGQKQRGWHRHEFDQKSKTACFRVPTPALERAVGQTQFLIRTLSELRIKLNEVDYGTLELFTAPGSADSPSD